MTDIVETITFADADAGKIGTAIIRVVGGIVGLSTFVVDGGECEIYMGVDVCERLAKALLEAARVAAQPG